MLTSDVVSFAFRLGRSYGFATADADLLELLAGIFVDVQCKNTARDVPEDLHSGADSQLFICFSDISPLFSHHHPSLHFTLIPSLICSYGYSIQA